MPFEQTFERPLFLLTLAIPVLLALRAWRQRDHPRAIGFSFLWLVDGPEQTLRQRLRWLPDALRLLTLTLLALALSGPVVARTAEHVEVPGLDILLLIDASRSMLAQDLAPNRFEAAKELAERLVAARPHDRFGLMTFAARAALQCPLTTDHTALVARLRRLTTPEREEGTALGVAVADGLRHVRATARNPVAIVLLTDGSSNAGQIAPGTAAAIAAGMNIRILAVGLGGSAPAPYPSEFGLLEITLDLDDRALEQLASATGGAYVPLTRDRGFEHLSSELDRLQAGPAMSTIRSTRAGTFERWLLTALVCLLLELALRATYLRTFP